MTVQVVSRMREHDSDCSGTINRYRLLAPIDDLCLNSRFSIRGESRVAGGNRDDDLIASCLRHATGRQEQEAQSRSDVFPLSHTYHSFKTLESSTSSDSRLRKMPMMIPKPTAA